MKAIIFTFILSIFLAGNICNAQEAKGQLSICNHTAKHITLSQLQKFTEESCGRVIYHDAEGNEVTITEYTIAMSPKKGGNAYFEQVKGDMVTATVKERLEKLNAGDMIVIAQIKCITKDGGTAMMNGTNYTVIE